MRPRSALIYLIQLIVLCLGLAGQAQAQRFVYVDSYKWQADIPHFGGFSGLWVDPTGAQFHTVNDRGWYVSGRLERTKGRIAAITIEKRGAIHGPNRPVPGDFKGDAEGLAISPDGVIHISFEAYHRIQKFVNGFEGKPKWLHKWSDFQFLQTNSGFEALAIDAAGVIYAIPERSGAWTRPFTVYRQMNGGWNDKFSIPRSNKFLVVGADFGPDGRLYILERQFTWMGGFQSRIRRFNLSETGFDQGRVLFESRPWQFDNLEGISIWTAQDGALMATAISDDNFMSIQSTTLVEFRLEE